MGIQDLLIKAINNGCSYKDINTYKVIFGADINERVRELTPLMHACNSKNLPALHSLLDLGADINNLSQEQINGLFMQACKDENLDVAKILLDHGANINVQDDKGLTPLMHACIKNNLDLVDFLLKNKAKVNIEDKNEDTCLLYAKDPEIFQTLIEYDAKISVRIPESDTMISISPSSIENYTELLLLNLLGATKEGTSV